MRRIAAPLGVFLIVFLAGASPVPQAPTRTTEESGVIVSPRDGHRVQFSDGRVLRVKVGPQSTDSTHLVMVEEDLPPGKAIPAHRHDRDEEILVVQRGSVTVTLRKGQVEVDKGSIVYLPRGVWISVKNTGSKPATIMAVFAHPDMEQCFRLLGKTAGRKATAEELAEEKRLCAWTY